MPMRIEYHREYNKRPHVREAMRQREQQPKRKREVYARHLQRKYGITFEHFNTMLLEQAGRCAICQKTMAERNEPHVDHCHRTGKVRGLLCFTCNLLLSNAKEDEAILARAADYLFAHKIPGGIEL